MRGSPLCELEGLVILNNMYQTYIWGKHIFGENLKGSIVT